jgi:poly-gamma-glutamate capsule biosynthesis protein CapA/YwtB (metallophosphatase superfamily)
MTGKHKAWFATLWLLVAGLSWSDELRHPNDAITLAAGGDLILPHRPLDRLGDPEFRKVADLFREADVGFANMEGSILDVNHFNGYPAAETGGGYPVRSPSMARDIKDIGISLVSKANNHATDWGPDGLVETLRNLSDAGVVAGGAGLNPDAARRPVYLNTHKGLIALVSTASTFPPSSVPGPAIEVPHQNTTSKPRPGINALHVQNVRVLPPELFENLRQAAGPFATHEGSGLRISDQVFRQGKVIGTRWEMNPSDKDPLLDAVEEARARADLVLFAIHAHETAGDIDEPPPVPYQPMVVHKADEAPSPNDPRPASFEVELFHAAVDHGADVVIRTGPHVIGGIEIYKGKPIFYGLGSLFLDFGGLRVLPTPSGENLVVPDSWYESFVPVSVFRSKHLQTLKLYPIVIEPNAGHRSGVPSIAQGQRARDILERLKELSAAFGTKVEVRDGVGLVQVPAG